MPSMMNQRALFQREVTPGTPLTDAMRDVKGLKVRPAYAVEGERFKASGSKVATVNVINNVSGSPAVEVANDFNAWTYALTGAYGSPTSALRAGAVTAMQHNYAISATAADPRVSFTVMWGDSTAAVQMPYFTFNGFGATLSRMSGSSSAQAFSSEPVTGVSLPAGTNEVQTVTITGTPTGGTFTLTYGGQTTAPIAYNATAAAVQSALEALSSIGAGNVATGGGPLPDTAVTVTFQGALGATDVALMTASGAALTGGTTPAVAVTETTPGVSNGITTVGSAPIAGRTWTAYIVDTWAALATVTDAEKVDAMYEATVSMDGKYEQDYVMDADLPSFADVLEADVTYTLGLTVGWTSQARANITSMKNGDVKFIRLESVGPLIEAGINYRATMDFCVTLTNVGEFTTAPNSQAVTLPFEAELFADPVSGNVSQVELINTVPAL